MSIPYKNHFNPGIYLVISVEFKNYQRLGYNKFMNINKIIAELKKKYPGKEIIFNPSTTLGTSPTEIIVEIEPSKDHPEYGTALAVVGKSQSHFHRQCWFLTHAKPGWTAKDHILV